MSCTTEIRSSETSFKLARSIVDALSVKFNFNAEEGWTVICNTAPDALIKKFRKNRKLNNPFRCVTKQRTSFSLFTKERRSKIAEQNPTANFAELSKLVSKAWNALTEKERQVYKDMEARDKERYRQECDAIRANLQPVAEIEAPQVESEGLASKKATAAPKKSKNVATTPASKVTETASSVANTTPSPVVVEKSASTKPAKKAAVPKSSTSSKNVAPAVQTPVSTDTKTVKVAATPKIKSTKA